MNALTTGTAFTDIESMIAIRFNANNNPLNSRPSWSRGSEVLLS